MDFTWFEKLVTEIEAGRAPHSTIVSFGIKFAILCGERDDSNVKQIVTSKLLDRLVRCIEDNPSIRSTSVELSLTLLLKKIITETDEGLEWLKRTRHWFKVISYENFSYTVYSIREAGSFIHEALRAFDRREDKETCMAILHDLLAPFINSIWLSQDMMVDICNLKTKDTLMKALKLLEQIYLKLIEHPELCHIPFYLRTLAAERLIWGCMDFAQGYDLSEQLIKVSTLANYLHFTNLVVPPGEKMERITIEKFSINYYNTIQFAIKRSGAELVLVATDLMHKLMYKIGPRRVAEESMHDSYNLKFGDQLFLMMLLPAMLVVKKNAPEEMVEIFCSQMYTNCGEQTLRHLYALRDTVRAKSDPTDVTVRYIQALCFSNHALQRHHAIYALEIFSEVILGFMIQDASSDPPILHLDNPRLLLITLQGLSNLIQEYNITFADLSKDLQLIKKALYLVNIRLETKIQIEAIKFAQLCINNFLGNNTSLIMNELVGSGLEQLTMLIFKRLHDTDWEIRDSILELLIFVNELAIHKYEVLQIQILEENICPVVVAMAKNDSECYVRATALMCLRAMVKVPKIWNSILKTMDLLDYLTTLLANEDEAIVRREAVNTLRVVNCALRAPRNEKVVSTMIHCAAIDLHWEVRLNALEYWKISLEYCFSQQGMSEGRFPQQIFSTQQKKIITVDEKEIHNRITQGLQVFATNGGLGVLLANLDDTTDIEVMKAVVGIINNLRAKLDRYGYVEKLLSNTTGSFGSLGSHVNMDTNNVNSQVGARMDITEDNSNNDDEVIETIVTADDINLLIGTHQNALNKLQLDNQYDSKVMDEFVKYTPTVFFQRLNQLNLDELLKSRTEWLSNTISFESLLEDIIFSFEDSDINGMDCY